MLVKSSVSKLVDQCAATARVLDVISAAAAAAQGVAVASERQKSMGSRQKGSLQTAYENTRDCMRQTRRVNSSTEKLYDYQAFHAGCATLS
jgi:hypothetical protein